MAACQLYLEIINNFDLLHTFSKEIVCKQKANKLLHYATACCWDSNIFEIISVKNSTLIASSNSK